MSSSYSQQRRPRKCRAEDISPFAPLERDPNSLLNNFNFNTDTSESASMRYSSVIGGFSLPENVGRPTKRMISAQAFPENFEGLSEIHAESTSPENGSDFRQSLQIDMKGLVGDAVGNVSLFPMTTIDLINYR